MGVERQPRHCAGEDDEDVGGRRRAGCCRGSTSGGSARACRTCPSPRRPGVRRTGHPALRPRRTRELILSSGDVQSLNVCAAWRLGEDLLDVTITARRPCTPGAAERGYRRVRRTRHLLGSRATARSVRPPARRTWPNTTVARRSCGTRRGRPGREFVVPVRSSRARGALADEQWPPSSLPVLAPDVRSRPSSGSSCHSRRSRRDAEMDSWWSSSKRVERRGLARCSAGSNSFPIPQESCGSAHVSFVCM